MIRYGWLCFLAIACSISAHAEENHEEQLNAIKEQIDEIQVWLKDARNQQDSLYQSLKASEQSISDLETKTSKVSDEVKTREKKITGLKKQASQLTNQIKSQQKNIQKHVRSAYLLSKQDSLKLILNTQDPASVARLLTYHDYFNRAYSEQINAFNQQITELESIEVTMKQEKSQLQVEAETLHEQQTALAKEKENQAQLMNELSQRISNKDGELKKLLQDREELEKVLASVKQQATNYIPSSDTRPFAEWKGKLPWPLNGEVTHRFGESRVQNKVSWEGVALAANEGTPVQAVYHGRVAFADALRGFGLLVIINHGDGYMSLYAHNQKLLSAVGNEVKSGDTIALSGSSDSNEPALYFEIRLQGKPLDPATWLSKKP